MKRKNIIQRTIAGFLLCLFVLAMTPEKVLHDFIANHTDESLHCKSSAVHLHSATANCHCDKMVVHTPFVTVDYLLPSFKAAAIASVHTCYLFTQPKEVPQHYLLRGPPAASFSC